MSRKLIASLGKGQKLVDFLKGTLGLNIAPKLEKLLLDENNALCDYDLLGVLKGELVFKILYRCHCGMP